MNNRGTMRERQVAEAMRDEGWVVVRSAGSLGPVDLVGLMEGMRPRFVQVKSDVKSPYDNFRPRDRELLVSLAQLAGADPWLVWWPPRRGLQWIAPVQWP